MAYHCEECGKKITQSNCLCEDWNDNDRSFGCPVCGIFYRRKAHKINAGLIGGVLAGGVSVPAISVFMYGYRNEDTYLMWLSGVIFASLGFLFVYTSFKSSLSYERSGYRKELRTHDVGI